MSFFLPQCAVDCLVAACSKEKQGAVLSALEADTVANVVVALLDRPKSVGGGGLAAAVTLLGLLSSKGWLRAELRARAASGLMQKLRVMRADALVSEAVCNALTELCRHKDFRVRTCVRQRAALLTTWTRLPFRIRRGDLRQASQSGTLDLTSRSLPADGNPVRRP